MPSSCRHSRSIPTTPGRTSCCPRSPWRVPRPGSSSSARRWAGSPSRSRSRLQLARSLIAERSFDEAESTLAAIEQKDPFDWRVHWYRGLSRLAHGEAKEARDRVRPRSTPSCPVSRPRSWPSRWRRRRPATRRGPPSSTTCVSRTDPSLVTAAFGLARCLARAGRRDAAVEAYRPRPAVVEPLHPGPDGPGTGPDPDTPAAPGANELQQASATA